MISRSCQVWLGMALLGLLFIKCGQSVVMPPRAHHLGDYFDNNIYFEDIEPQPYELTIDEGSSVDMKVQSKSHITVNLNQAIPEDINVTVKVYSGPHLITFSPVNSSVLTQTSSNSTFVTLTYPANTFGDRVVSFHTLDAAGHAEIVCSINKQPSGIKIDDSTAYISINIGKSWFLSSIINIVGWLYFAAWSVSFYFQVILNFQRKSVIGLNFDFQALNFLGFTCYFIYNFSFMFSREVRKDYYERNTYSRIPVEYNDLFFAAHALILTVITCIQCFVYERGDQRVSLPAGGFIATTSVAGILLTMAYLLEKIKILDVILYLSYVKLAITLIKYVPQAYMNYKRKATTGWSIHNILLDFTGGSLSITQMFLLAYNYDDWISIFGNFTKFGLGVISIGFDLLFVTQHYILYKQVGELEVSTESIPGPVISQSITQQPSNTDNDPDVRPEV